MSIKDGCKQSLYFPDAMLAELQAEAARMDRPLSWVLQRAWTLARKRLAAMPDSDGEPTTVRRVPTIGVPQRRRPRVPAPPTTSPELAFVAEVNEAASSFDEEEQSSGVRTKTFVAFAEQLAAKKRRRVLQALRVWFAKHERAPGDIELIRITGFETFRALEGVLDELRLEGHIYGHGRMLRLRGTSTGAA